MALTFFWRYENSLTLDGTHDYSAGDTTALANSSAAFDSGIAFVGTYAGDYPTNNDYHYFDSASIIDVTTGYDFSFGFAFYIEAWTAGGTLFHLVDSGTASNQAKLVMAGTSGSGNLQLLVERAGSASDSITLTGNNIALDTWYFAIARVDHNNTTLRIELYSAAGSLLDSVEDLAVTAGAFPLVIDTMRTGLIVAAGANAHMDNLFVADAYAEPIEDNHDITSYTEYGGAPADTSLIYIPNASVRGLIQR